jgi:carboxymethylenebutenolidase
MAHDIELTAADGHRLTAAIAPPAGKPLGGLLVIQEIFGLNSHMRDVCDQFAEAGFLAVAPAVFDRLGDDVTVEYSDIERGRELVGRLDPRRTILDLAAGVEHATRAGKVGAVGFCWGGAQAYRCAAELPVAAAVAYYGGGIHNMTDLSPACPVMLHYGDRDAHISMEQVQQVRAANPEAVVHVYEGVGHGFNCDQRDDYDPEAACLAFGRTTDFLKRHLA